MDKFGRPFPSGKYHTPSLTADAGVLQRTASGSLQVFVLSFHFSFVSQANKAPKVLLIRRGGEPFKGQLAFPGGFVDYNEAPEAACLRELKEETNLTGASPELVGVYGDPLRANPRKHIVTTFYHVQVEDYTTMKAGDDAVHAEFYDVEEAAEQELAFDHNKLLADLLEFHKKKSSSE